MRNDKVSKKELKQQDFVNLLINPLAQGKFDLQWVSINEPKPVTISVKDILERNGFKAEFNNLKVEITNDMALVHLHYNKPIFDFSGCKFNNSIIETNFSDAILNNTNFNNCTIKNSTFNNAQISDSIFNDTSIVDSWFKSAQFSQVEIKNSAISYSDFYGAHFENSIMENSTISHSDLINTNFNAQTVEQIHVVIDNAIFTSNTNGDNNTPTVGIIYYHSSITDGVDEGIIYNALKENQANVIALVDINLKDMPSSLFSEVRTAINSTLNGQDNLVQAILNSKGDAITYLKSMAQEYIGNIDALVGPAFGSIGTPFDNIDDLNNKPDWYINGYEVFHLMLIGEAIQAGKPILGTSDFTEHYVNLYLTGTFNKPSDFNEKVNFIQLDASHDSDFIMHQKNQELISNFVSEAQKVHGSEIGAGSDIGGNSKAISIDDVLQMNTHGDIIDASSQGQSIESSSLPHFTHQLLPDVHEQPIVL